MNTKHSKIKVSVATITYNHEEFIEETIKSIVEQKTSFDFELIIGEDFSTDRTRDIVKKYEMLYPSIVKPIYYEKNIGGRANFIGALKKCSGQYVAILDGDDIMLPGKLQKQYDFMEKNQDYAMCGHNVRVFENRTDKTIKFRNQAKTINKGTINTLAELGTYIANASVIYRSKFIDIELFDKLHDYAMQGDWLLHMLVARNGYVGYIDEVLSEYRIHESGVTQIPKGSVEKRKHLLEEQLSILDDAIILGASRESVDIGKTRLLGAVAIEMLKRKEYSEFKDYINQASQKKQPMAKRYKILFFLQEFPELLHWLVKALKHFKSN